MPEGSPPSASPPTYEVVGPRKGKSKKILLVLLVLLLMGAAAAGAWYYQQQKIDDLNQQVKDLQTASKQHEEPEKTVEKVQVAKPADNSYSVEAPVDWLTGTCEQSTLFLAPTEELLGKCATEYFGLVTISKLAGDQRATEEDFSDEALYSDVSFETTIINGLEGVKVKHTQAGEFEVGPPVGTKNISYQLFDGTNTYFISYGQQPGWPDHVDDFEAIAQSFDVL